MLVVLSARSCSIVRSVSLLHLGEEQRQRYRTLSDWLNEIILNQSQTDVLPSSTRGRHDQSLLWGGRDEIFSRSLSLAIDYILAWAAA